MVGVVGEKMSRVGVIGEMLFGGRGRGSYHAVGMVGEDAACGRGQ